MATCNACSVKAACTDGARGRTIQRSVYAAPLEKVRAYHATEAYQKAMRKRKVWVEPLFAEGKAWYGLRRLQWRGPDNANIHVGSGPCPVWVPRCPLEGAVVGAGHLRSESLPGLAPRRSACSHTCSLAAASAARRLFQHTGGMDDAFSERPVFESSISDGR